MKVGDYIIVNRDNRMVTIAYVTKIDEGTEGIWLKVLKSIENKWVGEEPTRFFYYSIRKEYIVIDKTEAFLELL